MTRCEHITCQLVDSAADNNLKRLKDGETFGIKKPGGESRIYLGQKSDEDRLDSFFGIHNEGDLVTLKVQISDLFSYLLKAKNEFLHPVHSYRLDIASFYQNLLDSTVALQQDFYIQFVKNTDKARYYLSPAPAGKSLYLKHIKPFCLPLLTYFDFIKVTNANNEVIYYFKPLYIQDEEEEGQTQQEIPDSLQIIFYGAPGTGKSFRAKGIVEGAKKAQADNEEENCVRTTFHPDTDYSTFVGAYKPTMERRERITETGHTVINQKTQAKVEDSVIEYSFVPQAFLKAYVKAWQRWARNPEKPEPFFLVIEEINRGNCAQIFGDLFQLLDRDENGESSYEISPDKDIQKFLQNDELGFAKKPDGTKADDKWRGLTAEELSALPPKIRDGEELKLPSNLRILATMNTSDQSLFPIDSAFKRRWDWQYEPIAEGRHPETQEPMGWKIAFSDGSEVDWWEFVQAINEVIENKIHSEDKKLGYFFCRPRNGVISPRMLLSKVIFYLWNDVFRDYGFSEAIFKVDGAKAIRYHEFYLPDGSPDEAKLRRFVENVLATRRPAEEPKSADN